MGEAERFRDGPGRAGLARGRRPVDRDHAALHGRPPPTDPAQRLGEAWKADRRAGHVVHPDPRARHGARARRRPWRAGDRRRSHRAARRLVAALDVQIVARAPRPRHPTERRFPAISPSRSLSFTRSSPTWRKMVVPSARAASTASSGISSMSPGISPGSDLGGPERGPAAPGDRRPARRNARSTCSTPTAAPMRSSTARNPVRVGFTPTPAMRSSPASASTAAPTRNAADDGSPGTWSANGSSRPLGAKRIQPSVSSTR